MKIEDRFERRENEDMVILGDLVEKHMNGDFGRVFQLIIESLKSMEITNSRSNTGSSDKVLGRLEAYETVISEFAAFIQAKQELQRPIGNMAPETELASEQVSPIRGGEI